MNEKQGAPLRNDSFDENQNDKLDMKLLKPILLALALLSAAALVLAQHQDPPPQGGPGGPPPPPPPCPIMEALDLNHDGIISADEIAKASDSLKTLDKNGDGQLTPNELRPPRPEGPR